MANRLTRHEIKMAQTSGMVVNPSRIDTFPHVWIGAPKPGSRWTAEQLAKLEKEREGAKALDSRFGAAIALKLRDLERVEGHTVDLGDHQVECPLLARSKNRQRVLVISPGGEKLWINVL